MTPVVEYTEGPPRKYTVNGDVVPSVTQILGALDKPALIWWGMQTGVNGLAALHRQGVEIPWEDPEGCCKLLTEHKLTVNHVRDTAATRGQSIHDALEAFAATGEIPDLDQFLAEDRGYVQGLARAMLALTPEFVATEVMVGSAVHGFAGRYDAKCVIDGRTVLIDLKTSKRTYPTQMLQMAAYALADAEMGNDPVDGCLVVNVHADGSHEITESYATAEMFLGVKAAWEAMQELKAAKPRKRRAKRTAVPA